MSTNECPRSASTPLSEMMLQLHLRNKALPGLNILGPGDELPAKMVDAFEVLAVEEQRTDRELEIAMRTRPPQAHE